MENIMLQDARKEQIKIVDFGLSNIYTGDNPLRTHCGSPEYAAPELFVVGKKYGPEVDLWSLGVVLYGMATGRLPFLSPRDGQISSEERRRRLLSQINRGLTAIQKKGIATMSTEFRNLVQRLLMPAANKRITIRELCFHPWITNRQKSLVKFASSSDLDSMEHSTIVNGIAEATRLDRAYIEMDVMHEKYGEIGGMYNIKAHEMQQSGSGHAFQATTRTWSLSQSSRYHYTHSNTSTPPRPSTRPLTRNQSRCCSPTRTPVSTSQPTTPANVQRRMVFHRTVAKSSSSGGGYKGSTWAAKELRDSSSYSSQRSSCPVHQVQTDTSSHQKHQQQSKWGHCERLHIMTRTTNKSIENFTERPGSQPQARHPPRPAPASPAMPAYPRHRPLHPAPGIIPRDPVDQWIDIQRDKMKNRDKRASARVHRQATPSAAKVDRVTRIAVPTLSRSTQPPPWGTMGQGDRAPEQRFYRSATNRTDLRESRTFPPNGTRVIERSNVNPRPVTTTTDGKISRYEMRSQDQYQYPSGSTKSVSKPTNNMW